MASLVAKFISPSARWSEWCQRCISGPLTIRWSQPERTSMLEWMYIPQTASSAPFIKITSGWAPSRTIGAYSMVWLMRILWRSFPGGLSIPSAPPGFPVAVWSCLLLWLLHWTARGALTLRELIALMAGEDRIQVSGGAMSIESRLGPFVRARRLDLADVLDVELSEEGALIARTRGAPLLLTNYGTRVGRSRLRGDLRQALGRPPQDA
jgi:hypothetical protein